jgi:hypothetical protein
MLYQQTAAQAPGGADEPGAGPGAGPTAGTGPTTEATDDVVDAEIVDEDDKK